VIQGQASFAQQGNSLVVTTQNGAGLNHSAINWQSFSIPAGSATRFVQPSASSLSINRVVGSDPSAIYGTLSSNGRLVLVNPVVVREDGADVAREGCLSIPHLTANVRRATTIEVEAQGTRFRSSGFEARCVLHEIDHLDGLLFLDRVDSLSTDVFRRKNYR
jgi:filamentous hemagglutinin family protein